MHHVTQTSDLGHVRLVVSTGRAGRDRESYTKKGGRGRQTETQMERERETKVRDRESRVSHPVHLLHILYTAHLLGLAFH